MRQKFPALPRPIGPTTAADARGAPGDPVTPGLFPRNDVKQARLDLAATGHWDVAQLLAVAAAGRSYKRPYFAHDALACALVHPKVTAEQKIALLLDLSKQRLGWRARKKAWRIAHWAFANGYVAEASLTPALRHIFAPRRRNAPERNFIDTLIDTRKKWERYRARMRLDATPYVSIAELGREVFTALLNGCRDPWIDRFFAELENALVEGNSETQNLVVVGSFESLQGLNYHKGDADLVERRLGPASKSAWVTLLQGWHGANVRSVAEWRALRSSRQG